jgi:hypothetical protein
MTFHNRLRNNNLDGWPDSTVRLSGDSRNPVFRLHCTASSLAVSP